MDLIKYLSIPYAFDGRSFNGCDCYGLVLLYFKNEMGIDLLDFKGGGDSSLEGPKNAFCDIHLRFERVDGIKANDFILFDHPAGMWHCGVMIDSKTLLQTDSKHGCTAVKLSRMPIPVHAAYRHKG